MKRSLVKLFVLIVLLSAPVVCFSQQLRVDPSVFDGQGGYFTKWDSVQDRLLLYRNTSGPVPAARIFKRDGTSVAMNPVSDLQDARYIDVWDVAATPDGGLVIAAIVGYTTRDVRPPQLKSFILTYDENGHLTRAWDVEPYHHHRIAVDERGSVYALGDNGSTQPYPLVMKYSKEGKPIGDMLYSTTFTDTDYAIDNGYSAGDPRMFIQGEELVVWISENQELFRYTLHGKLIDRVPLASTLQKLLAATNGDHFYVDNISTDREGRIYAQAHLWPKAQDTPVPLVMIEASKNGERAIVLPSSIHGQFLGKSASGKSVYLERDGKGGIVKEY
jgi:hypothetical protein